MPLVTFIAAMKQYFGVKKGESVTDFAREMKELTYEDKCEFHRMLVEQAGIDCDPPADPSAKKE